MSRVIGIPLDEDGNPISTGSGSEFLDSYTHNDPGPTQARINIEPDHIDPPRPVVSEPLGPPMVDPPRGEARAGSDNNGSTSNTIDTSTQSEDMSPTNRPVSNNNNPGQGHLSDYLNTFGSSVRNITPQFRERSMVDVELDRGGRKSALIAVGQHRDSPHMGYTNDFAESPIPYLNWGSSGASGVLPGVGNMGQQTDSGNIGGQQASGQGSAAGAGNYGGPNINISNVNNPQAVANTGTIQDSTISNPATGTASQTTSDNTNTNTNTNEPV